MQEIQKTDGTLWHKDEETLNLKYYLEMLEQIQWRHTSLHPSSSQNAGRRWSPLVCRRQWSANQRNCLEQIFTHILYYMCTSCSYLLFDRDLFKRKEVFIFSCILWKSFLRETRRMLNSVCSWNSRWKDFNKNNFLFKLNCYLFKPNKKKYHHWIGYETKQSQDSKINTTKYEDL